MITAGMKNKLILRGHSPADIKNMTPAQAHAILSGHKLGKSKRLVVLKRAQAAIEASKAT
jgi:hypothetical protein